MILSFKNIEIFPNYIVKCIFLITMKIKDQDIIRSVLNKSTILIFNSRIHIGTNAGNICKNL